MRLCKTKPPMHPLPATVCNFTSTPEANHALPVCSFIVLHVLPACFPPAVPPTTPPNTTEPNGPGPKPPTNISNLIRIDPGFIGGIDFGGKRRLLQTSPVFKDWRMEGKVRAGAKCLWFCGLALLGCWDP